MSSRSRWKQEQVQEQEEEGQQDATSSQGDPHRVVRQGAVGDAGEAGGGGGQGEGQQQQQHQQHRHTLSATSYNSAALDRSTSTFRSDGTIGEGDSHIPLVTTAMRDDGDDSSSRAGQHQEQRSIGDNHDGHERSSMVMHPLAQPSSSPSPSRPRPRPRPPLSSNDPPSSSSGKASSPEYMASHYPSQQHTAAVTTATDSTPSNDTSTSLPLSSSSFSHPFHPLESGGALTSSDPPRLHPRFTTTDTNRVSEGRGREGGGGAAAAEDVKDDNNTNYDNKDNKKKLEPLHTIEIISASPPRDAAIQLPPSSSSQMPQHQHQQQQRRRRRFFPNPVSTITSSMHAAAEGTRNVGKSSSRWHYKRKKHGGGQNVTATTTSSAAGLLSAQSSGGNNHLDSSHHQHHLRPDDGRKGAPALLASSSSEFGSSKKAPSTTGGTSPASSPSLEAGVASSSSSGGPINDLEATNGVLRRVYDSWALIGLSVANIGPVAGAFFGVHTAREYGGYSMLAIGWPLSGICMCLFSAVLAELSSSYPVAGAMFTWTFRTCRLSPTLRPFARYLSWLTGSLLLCGHILSQMLLEYQIATVFQGLIIIYAQNYEPTVWRTIGLAWGCLLISGSIAVTRMGRSPYLWKGVSILVGSTVVIIVVSVFACNSARNPASFIFTSYRNESGWTSKGYVYLLGWVLTSIATGQDISSHLAEESKHPSKSVPRGVFWGTALSYLIGWVVMLCVMAVTPEDPHGEKVSRDYGAPAQMLTEVLPRPLAFFILLLIVLLMIFQDTAQLLASSRFMWALARDSAIPLSPYLRRLSSGSQLPVRATWTVCIIAAPCLMLIAGSKQIVTSLILAGCGTSLVLAYTIPVLCYLTCPPGALDMDGRNEWTLRGASKYVATFGCCYIGLIIVMMCCPNNYPVTSTSFSYAAPVIVFVLLLSSLTWILYGNSHYAGPIKSITVYTIGREVELPKLTTTHSTNRNTPGSGRPTDPNGTSGPTVTTQADIGKTANLYSESLATMDIGRQETMDLSQDLVTQSWRSSELNTRNESRRIGPTDTQATEYSDYTDGSYTDSQSDDGSESDEQDDRRPSVRRPAPGISGTPRASG